MRQEIINLCAYAMQCSITVLKMCHASSASPSNDDGFRESLDRK